MEFFKKEFKQPTLVYKYARQKESQEFYYPLTFETINGWAESGLSNKAMILLLIFSTIIKEDYQWDVKISKFRSEILKTEDDLKEAYEELIDKGYAVKVGGKIYMRNDKRVDFPIYATAKSAQNSSYSWNKEEYVPAAESEFDKFVNNVMSDKRGGF